MKWLPWQDDDWPDWAHTAAVMAIASAFALLWLWPGIKALVSGSLPPIMGPNIGVWMFGPQVLTGRATRIGGSALVLLGLVFLSWGVACTRWAEPHRAVRLLPWWLLGLDLLLYRWADAST